MDGPHGAESERKPEENPLDLNNLPNEYSEQYHQGEKHALELEKSSATICITGESKNTRRIRKKKRSASKEAKEYGMTYECRFCSLKFSKSQALGGHMNCHRQEKETETLNRARELVLNSENLAARRTYLGCDGPWMNFQKGNVGDPSPSIRSNYTKIQSPSSSSVSYLYPPSWHLLPFPTPHFSPSTDNFFVCGSSRQHDHHNANQSVHSNSTCNIRAPMSYGPWPPC